MEPEHRIDAYIRHLETERRLSPHTLTAYRRDLLSLIRFTRRNAILLEEMDSHGVRRFAAECHRRGLSPRSVARRLSAVRCFFAFLLRWKVVRSNPAVDVQAPKPARRLPATLDADQMAGLLTPRSDVASGEDRVRGNDEAASDDPLTIRDRAMLELFYSSGLRLSELAGLDLCDLDAADRTVRVTGKGSKTRVVPVGAPALAALQAWIAVRGAMAKNAERALLSAGAARGSPRAPCRSASSSGRGARARRSACIRTCSGTPLPATCSNRAATCGQSRNSWATPAFPPPRSIRTLIFSISPRYTTGLIPAPGAGTIRPLATIETID